jgi:hypothetical protein
MTIFLSILTLWIFYKISCRNDKKRGYSTRSKPFLDPSDFS